MPTPTQVPQVTLEELSGHYTTLALSLIELGQPVAAAMKQAAKKCPAGEMAFQKLQRQKAAAAAPKR